MNIFAHIGAWLMVPFIAFAGFFGMTSHVQMGPGPVHIASSTMSTTSTTIISPAHPIKPVGGNAPMQPAAPPAEGSVTIDSISPSTNLAVGTVVTITGSGFTADNKILLDGMLNSGNVTLSSFTNGHQTITFTIASALTADCKAGEACPMYARLLTSGTYQLSVENENGDSNAINVSITGSAPIQVQ